MTLDTVFTVLNAVWTVLLAGLGIEMVNNPPDVIWKKRLYRGLFVLFGGAVLVTTTIQSVHNSKEQQNLKDEAQKIQTALSNKVSEQGGKLDAIVEFQQQFLSVMSHREASG